MGFEISIPMAIHPRCLILRMPWLFCCGFLRGYLCWKTGHEGCRQGHWRFGSPLHSRYQRVQTLNLHHRVGFRVGSWERCQMSSFVYLRLRGNRVETKSTISMSETPVYKVSRSSVFIIIFDARDCRPAGDEIANRSPVLSFNHAWFIIIFHDLFRGIWS